MTKKLSPTNLNLAMIATVIFMSVALSSCVDDHSFEISETSRVVRMSLSSIGFPTKAGENQSSEETFSGIDNIIDPDDILIASFDCDGNLIEEICNSARNPDFIQTNSDSGISFDWDIYGNKYKGKGEITVVAVANASSFSNSESPVMSRIPATLEEFRSSLVFDIPSDQNSYELSGLPQYAIVRLHPSELMTSESPRLEMKLKRAVAKIEIVNGMNDGCEIISASMSAYNSHGMILPDSDKTVGSLTSNSGTDETTQKSELKFRKSDDGKTLYAYVAEMDLSPDPKATNRRIDLIVKGNSETRKTNIWLSPYNGDEPRQATNDEPQWQTLLRNHLYRFTISGIIPSGPKITDTILIRWYYNNKTVGPSNNYGKFNTDYFDKIRIYDINKGWIDYESYTIAYPDKGDGCVNFTVPLDPNESHTAIKYIIYNNSYQTIEGDLFEDAVKIEIDKDTNYTCFYLNNPLLNLSNNTTLFTNYPYRFYCRNDNYYAIKIQNPYNGSYYCFPSAGKYQTFDSDSRGYKYVEFSLESKSITNNNNSCLFFCIIDNRNTEINNIPYEGYYGPIYGGNDIFIQEIDGQNYYVFYLD